MSVRTQDTISYTVWPVHGDGGEFEILTAAEATARYGDTTIAALEKALVLNPGVTVALHGRWEELLIEFLPVDGPRAKRGGRRVRGIYDPQ